jgi:hypothetical protein
MPTVVDSLIVTLGLDPTQFNKGQKEAATAFLKTRQEAEKSGKLIEASAKKTADAITKVTREVLGLYAVFLGARGFKEFVAQLNTADAALGRFSRNLNTSPQTLAAWGSAAERMGGSAEATATTFERIGKALYDLHRNGQMLPKEFAQLQALSGRRIDTDHGVDRFLRDTASALKAMNAIDPSQAHFLAQGMGIDDATANVMIKYGDAIGAYLDELKKLSPSNDAIKAAQELQEQWSTLQQTAVSLANTILETLGPVIGELLKQMTEWLKQNQDWLRSGVVDGVRDFASYLKSIDWNAVGSGLRQFGEEAKHVADAVGGITTATELLFALWAGSKAIGLISSLRGAMGGGAASAGGGGLMALLGRLGPFAAMLSLSGDTPKGGASGGWQNDPRADRWIDEYLAQRGTTLMPGTGGSTRGRYRGAQMEPDRERSLGDFLGGSVNGRPVSKSNPLPVTLSDQAGSGGGFWSKVGSTISSWFGGAAGGAGGGNDATSPLSPTGASAGERGWWTKARQQHAYDRLRKEAGLSDQGAKGLISRWANVEASGGPTSVNHIGALGIAQMLGDRKQRLLQMSGQTGKSWKDYDLQLSHIIEELNGKEARAAAKLKSASTAADGAIGASMFERAEGYNRVSGRDNFTSRTLGGMAGIGDYINSVMAGSALSSIQNDNSVKSSSTSSSMHVGQLNVNTQAKDSKGIASSITDSLFRSTLAATANSGPQ